MRVHTEKMTLGGQREEEEDSPSAKAQEKKGKLRNCHTWALVFAFVVGYVFSSSWAYGMSLLQIFFTSP